MAIIYIVRHGRAAASFAEDLDPGLDDPGRQQAHNACDVLMAHLPLKLVSSPLNRARETAQPLRQQSGSEIQIEPRVAEIPSPGVTLAERGPWLREIMQGNWADQSAELQSWKQDLIEFLVGLDSDTAIFSHFIAINAAT
ncbi:MAG: histidine phosphatase family protein, partial [Pseudomonadales bacterium]